ncbi:Enoyl-CoA-hydratase [Geodia barretti]|uniref:Enoyl-CoA-hydratase n=1 Tax=Geodia barretti TaxID=519541 RepID=A0AA35SM22_GEOBA|nr:Enoyl-CoA-hydratase [Geodia barretti]
MATPSAGGLELAMACDIIIAADHAEVGLPEPRVGLIAGAGGVHRLPRHVPFKIAMGMLLTARRIPIQEAYRLGLVNEVVPSERPHGDRRTLGKRHSRSSAPLSARK